MLKKEITFKDLEGKDVTETFYFALNEAEIAEMNISMAGGMEGQLRRITQTEDGAAAIAMFKEILWKAIGRKSDDSRRFIKSDDIWLDFSQTDAYNVLFMELLTDPKKAAEFIKGIVPANMAAKIPDEAGVLELPAPIKRGLTDYTTAELENLPKEELAELLEKHSGNVPKEILVLAMRRAK